MFNNVGYWLELADEDISVAKVLLNGKKHLQMGFFCHLIAEKALKAAVADVTEVIPPKTHDLIKLTKLADIYNILTESQIAFLNKLMPLHIEARYPDYKRSVAKTLNAGNCRKIFEETEEFLCWIKQKLEK